MFKDVIGWALLFVQSFAIMYLENMLLSYSINIVCVLLVMALNKELLAMLINGIKSKIKLRR